MWLSGAKWKEQAEASAKALREETKEPGRTPEWEWTDRLCQLRRDVRPK